MFKLPSNINSRSAPLATELLHTDTRATASPRLTVIRKLYVSVVDLNTVVLVVLPTGSLFNFNVKIVLFCLLVPLALSLELSEDHFGWTDYLSIILVPAALLFWFYVAFTYDGRLDLSLLQARDIIATVAGAWFISIYCCLSEGGALRFIKVLIAGSGITACFKLIVVLYSSVTGVDVTVYVQQISNFFNFQLMMYDFDSSSLGRFQLVSDGLLPLSTFALLTLRPKLAIKPWFASILTVAFVFSTFLTFSRYFWGYMLLALALAYIAAKLEKFHGLLLLILSAATVSSLSVTSGIVQQRFSEFVLNASDSARDDQHIALAAFFKDAPILGHGLGSYVPAFIRSDVLPYTYEDQIGALAGQVGIVGCSALLLLLFVFYFQPFLRSRVSATYKAALLGLLAFFLYGGFTNPLILSSTASVSYGLLLALLLVDPSQFPEGRNAK